MVAKVLAAGERNRMILDLPPEVQMAIRLVAVKRGITTGDVVALAVRGQYPRGVEEATETLRARVPQEAAQ